MQLQLGRIGALTIAVGMLTLVVAHGGLAGCHSEEPPVATASAEPLAPSKGVESAKPAGANGLGAAGVTVSSSAPVATAVHASPSAPIFMGASKAAPVFRGDQMKAALPPAVQAANPPSNAKP